MTVKKAIKILDLLIENKAQVKSGVLDLLHQWSVNGEDVMTRNAKMIVNLLQNDVDWLQGTKRQLLPEQHRTKIVCRHPKKDHDTDGSGQKYCMNCNANL
ncbi:MAG: hypothetical protein KGH81_07145 [Thaumarchaeota archaeon]|nr:hypothetical protein [Nitrososphaerota archaeon]MDE1872929.1 hypothetical protein [Nitrososphaerota archaeon]